MTLPQAAAGTGSLTIPLRQLATFNFSEGPNQISRENGKRRVVVTAEVRGRDIGSLVEEAQGKVAEQVSLPAGYWLAWGGQFENFEAARQRLMIVVPVCFALIFLLLLSALGSARDALLVFSAVPARADGRHCRLVAPRHDILHVRRSRVHRALRRRRAQWTGDADLHAAIDPAGLDKDDAIRVGAITRLRPVVITALVASLGFVPMAFATGTGAEVQKPLATVVIGGLISATVLTLFVLPALYAYFTEEARPKHDVGIAGTSFTSADNGVRQ